MKPVHVCMYVGQVHTYELHELRIETSACIYVYVCRTSTGFFNMSACTHTHTHTPKITCAKHEVYTHVSDPTSRQSSGTYRNHAGHTHTHIDTHAHQISHAQNTKCIHMSLTNISTKFWNKSKMFCTHPHTHNKNHVRKTRQCIHISHPTSRQSSGTCPNHFSAKKRSESIN